MTGLNPVYDQLAALEAASPGVEFEVVLLPTGDRATAVTAAGVMLAARTLRDEARDHGCGVRQSIIFTADGRHVRTIEGSAL